jgi:hypothetical protein
MKGHPVSERDFRIVTGPIRPTASSQNIDVYNDGLVGFLFDEANLQKIREADPPIIWGAGSEAYDDETTQKLLQAGDLLFYGLHGDGGISIEILAGEPLTPEELASGRWFEPQTGYLHLPSGRLWVHSYNSLPMGDNGDEPCDEGGLATVPPGHYRVTLYRKDWGAMEKEGLMSFSEAQEAGIDIYGSQRLDEVLVLTPLDAPQPQPNILFRYCIE